MKVKTLAVCAATATALPLGSAWAADPTGPQGTQWYGRSVATFDQVDVNNDGVISRDEYASTGDTRGERGGAYSGPSWATNPPAPAP